MIWIFRFFDFLSVVFPIKIFYFLSKLIGALAYYLGLYSKGKRNVIENLKQAGIKSSGFLSFVNFARYLGEFMSMSKLNRKNLQSYMEPVRINRLKTALAKGKGAIVYTGHIGNWELGAAMLAILGYLASLVSIRYMNQAMTTFYEMRRKKKGLGVIYIGKVKEMIRVLKRGQILATAGDRVYSGKEMEVTFFGKLVKFPFGAFLLAQVTKAPIIPSFAVREKGKIRVYFEEPIFVRNKEDIPQALSLYVAILEKYIKQYPDQWCAYDSIWTTHLKN